MKNPFKKIIEPEQTREKIYSEKQLYRAFFILTQQRNLYSALLSELSDKDFTINNIYDSICKVSNNTIFITKFMNSIKNI